MLKDSRICCAEKLRRQWKPVSDQIGAPVVFFKASTGIDDLSWNSGFHLLASWALRLKGIPVVYFACNSGMSKCVLGTNRDNPHKEMPCKSCVYQSRTLYKNVQTFERSNVSKSGVNWFDFQRDEQLAKAIREVVCCPSLMTFEWQDIPLGELCLPGLALDFAHPSFG